MFKPNFSKLYVPLIITGCLLLSCSGAFAQGYTADYTDNQIPEFTLAIPGMNKDTTSQPEEKELRIAWNQWHANVNNKILHCRQMSRGKMVDFDYPKYWSFSVDNFGNIINIVGSMCLQKKVEKYWTVEKDKNGNDVPVLKRRTGGVDNVVYSFEFSTKKYYRSEYFDNKLLSTVEIQKADTPFKDKLEGIANIVNTFQHDPVLTYPRGSKRTLVNVSGSSINIRGYSNSKFNASDYNDYEYIQK